MSPLCLRAWPKRSDFPLEGHSWLYVPMVYSINFIFLTETSPFFVLAAATQVLVRFLVLSFLLMHNARCSFHFVKYVGVFAEQRSFQSRWSWLLAKPSSLQ